MHDFYWNFFSACIKFCFQSFNIFAWVRTSFTLETIPKRLVQSIGVRCVTAERENNIQGNFQTCREITRTVASLTLCLHKARFGRKLALPSKNRGSFRPVFPSVGCIFRCAIILPNFLRIAQSPTSKSISIDILLLQS